MGINHTTVVPLYVAYYSYITSSQASRSFISQRFHKSNSSWFIMINMVGATHFYQESSLGWPGTLEPCLQIVGIIRNKQNTYHYSGKLFLTPSNLSKIPRARFKNINKIKHVSVYLNGFIQNTHQKSQFRLTFFFLRSLHKYRKPTLSIDLFQRYSRKIMQE